MDRLYLQAEALWRQSDLAAAAEVLSHARQLDHSNSKCAELQVWVESRQHKLDAADAAFEDGEHLHLPVSSFKYPHACGQKSNHHYLQTHSHHVVSCTAGSVLYWHLMLISLCKHHGLWCVNVER